MVYLNHPIETMEELAIFGSRMLKLVNKTEQSGTVFQNVRLNTLRKKRHSYIFINKYTPSAGEEIKNVGVFLGEEIQNGPGLTFLAHSHVTKNGVSLKYSMVIVAEGETITSGQEKWRLVPDKGWEQIK